MCGRSREVRRESGCTTRVMMLTEVGMYDQSHGMPLYLGCNTGVRNYDQSRYVCQESRSVFGVGMYDRSNDIDQSQDID
jgi:hypothetical protein